MKLENILTDIQSKVEDSNKSRRDVISDIGKMSLSAALVALPLGLAALSNPRKVMANPNGAIDVLQFALTLEYLEDEFYRTGVESGIFNGSDLTVIKQISKHESEHVQLLKNAIKNSNATPGSKPEFDFTAGGNFNDVFTNPATFMALAQAFEDTGVRAYKGQAGELAGTATLTVALQIHSVEARHASQIRRMRGDKGWITGSDSSSLPAPAAPIYAGEDNIMQGGVDVTTITSVSRDRITEAFDEPLSMKEVLDIAKLFLV